MATNHAVSELVTCLKNGQLARREKVSTTSSKMKLGILEILKKDGFIEDYCVIEGKSYPVVEISLAYNGNEAVIKDIKVLSKPGKRLYAGADEVPVVYNGLGLVILSTPKGILPDYEAKHLNVGGELLLQIF